MREKPQKSRRKADGWIDRHAEPSRRAVLKATGALGASATASGVLSTPARAYTCTLPDDSNSQDDTSYIEKYVDSKGDEQYYRPDDRYYSTEHRQGLLYLQSYESNDSNYETEHVFAYHGYGMGSRGQLEDDYDSYPVIGLTSFDIDLGIGSKVEYDPWNDQGGRPSPDSSEEYKAAEELYAAAQLVLTAGGFFDPISTAENLTTIIKPSDRETDTHYWEWDYDGWGECVSEHEHVLYFTVPSTQQDVQFDLLGRTKSDDYSLNASLDWDVYADYNGGNPDLSVKYN